jgi:hypothetical protein
MASTSILDAMHDARLFAPFFRGGTWGAWEAFLAALWGLDMPPDQLDTFRACTGRVERPTRRASEGWVIAGRRSGKSRIAAFVAAYLAALAETDKLARGEYGTVLVCATDKQQARVILDYVRALFEVPALRALVVSEGAESIELRHKVRIEVRSSSYRRVRGVTLLACVLDELAFFRDESSALPDVELYRALKPALATTGGLILGISSPWSRRGLLWSKYKRHWGQDGDVIVWQSDSRTMNPALSAELVADAMAEDPEAGAAEWQGQFRSDLSGFISREVLDRCIVVGRQGVPRRDGVRYYGFCDPSGGSSDSYTLAIAHTEDDDGRSVVVLDHLSERRPPFSPEEATREFSRVLRLYGCDHVVGDRYAGEWPREQFRKGGVEYVTSERTKSQLYVECVPLLTAARVKLLDHGRMILQWLGLERRASRTGKDSVDHQPGGRDDLSNAAAGALVTAATGAADAGAVLAANLRDTPRARILDEREFELLGRGDY